MSFAHLDNTRKFDLKFTVGDPMDDSSSVQMRSFVLDTVFTELTELGELKPGWKTGRSALQLQLESPTPVIL